MTHVQEFFRDGMRKNGYGPITFDLDRRPDGQVNIIMVKGSEPTLSYHRASPESKEKVCSSVRQEFAKHGLNLDREVVVIFQVLMTRDPGRSIEIGPFVGGGNGMRGAAFVFDDIHLDAALLPSKQPDPYAPPGTTIGKFNTTYIGGIAHELGHALGLPHDGEGPGPRRFTGRSIMGRGNHDYGEDLRGEGLGAILSAASAFPLSLHPLFTKKEPEQTKVDFTITRLKAEPVRGQLKLEAAVEGSVKAVGLVALNDHDADPKDYDAMGWVAPITSDGSFRCLIGNLAPGAYNLSLRVYAEDGPFNVFTYSYRVDALGRIDTTQLQIGD